MDLGMSISNHVQQQATKTYLMFRLALVTLLDNLTHQILAVD